MKSVVIIIAQNFQDEEFIYPYYRVLEERYKKYYIGNIIDQPFKEKVMNELISPRFNAKTMCGTLCVQHKVNEALDKLKKGEITLEKPSWEPPLHLNFI